MRLNHQVPQHVQAHRKMHILGQATNKCHNGPNEKLECGKRWHETGEPEEAEFRFVQAARAAQHVCDGIECSTKKRFRGGPAKAPIPHRIRPLNF